MDVRVGDELVMKRRIPAARTGLRFCVRELISDCVVRSADGK